MVPFAHLVLRHREIGIHRGRLWGFRDVFGFTTLRDVPFVTLASKVKAAYEGQAVPSHDGWPAQREALRWLVEKGRDGIYALDEQGIKLMLGRRSRVRDRPADQLMDGSPNPTGGLADTAPSSESQTFEQPRVARQALIQHASGDAALETETSSTIRNNCPPDTLDDADPNTLTNSQSVLDTQRLYLDDGHHRALALYILGEDAIRASFLTEDELRLHITR